MLWFSSTRIYFYFRSTSVNCTIVFFLSWNSCYFTFPYSYSYISTNIPNQIQPNFHSTYQSAIGAFIAKIKPTVADAARNICRFKCWWYRTRFPSARYRIDIYQNRAFPSHCILEDENSALQGISAELLVPGVRPNSWHLTHGIRCFVVRYVGVKMI